MMIKSPMMRGVKVTTNNSDSDYGHWDISEVGPFDPTEWFGFVYEVIQKSTGKSYIGRKQFKFKRKKTKSNKSRTKPSDWLDYTTSSELVQSLIEETGMDDFEFRILKLCSGKCELNYEEESLQREKDVLRARLSNGERQYLNGTIAYKNFGGLEKQTEESKAKIRAALLGKKHTPEQNEAHSKYMMGKRNGLGHQYIPTLENNAANSKRMMGNKNAGYNAADRCHWWNNGIKNTRKTECPGEGWIAGRLPFNKTL